MKYRNPLPVLLRAMLGGAIVGFTIFVVSMVSFKITRGYIPWGYLLIILGIPLALGVGASIGALIGMSIWIISVISGRTFGIVGRAIIGVVSALVIVSAYAFFNTEEPGYYHPIYSWTEQAVYWLLSGLILGLLPAIMAREKSARLKI